MNRCRAIVVRGPYEYGYWLRGIDFVYAMFDRLYTHEPYRRQRRNVRPTSADVDGVGEGA